MKREAAAGFCCSVLELIGFEKLKLLLGVVLDCPKIGVAFSVLCDPKDPNVLFSAGLSKPNPDGVDSVAGFPMLELPKIEFDWDAPLARAPNENPPVLISFADVVGICGFAASLLLSLLANVPKLNPPGLLNPLESPVVLFDVLAPKLKPLEAGFLASSFSESSGFRLRPNENWGLFVVEPNEKVLFGSSGLDGSFEGSGSIVILVSTAGVGFGGSDTLGVALNVKFVDRGADEALVDGDLNVNDADTLLVDDSGSVVFATLTSFFSGVAELFKLLGNPNEN